MSKGRFLLQQLIFHYQNDLVSSSEEHVPNIEEIKDGFNSLIRSVTRYVNDFRYCSKKDCPCSPERDIGLTLPVLKQYLINTKTALYPIPYETLEQIMKEGLDE